MAVYNKEKKLILTVIVELENPVFVFDMALLKNLLVCFERFPKSVKVLGAIFWVICFLLSSITLNLKIKYEKISVLSFIKYD